MIQKNHYAFMTKNILKELENLENVFYVQDKQIITVKINLFLFVLISVNKKLEIFYKIKIIKTILIYCLGYYKICLQEIK